MSKVSICKEGKRPACTFKSIYIASIVDAICQRHESCETTFRARLTRPGTQEEGEKGENNRGSTVHKRPFGSLSPPPQTRQARDSPIGDRRGRRDRRDPEGSTPFTLFIPGVRVSDKKCPSGDRSIRPTGADRARSPVTRKQGDSVERLSSRPRRSATVPLSG